MKGLLGSHRSKGLNFQGPKGSSNSFMGGYRTSRTSVSTLVPCLEGLHERNVFQGKKAKGFRVSRDGGLPLAGWGFQEVWRFQNPRVSGKIYKI